ncbi:carboxypeptidase-like regulatory domain-containing protein [Nannocystis radixulma]|uniref:Carboxypeptidase-like regulatory domain-containing protein n=1 Tax=Nannocystis radixulma TaxID=2995305 RepID=A0ABT5BHN9_9BACT|nr:carboxypeptidase-like regulatory domain-containing protein [Nannocystis radixulma]MDC0672486.1 carboxypeptidase-like regulatory domain-containing protein [Nannocystis radixulma]
MATPDARWLGNLLLVSLAACPAPAGDDGRSPTTGGVSTTPATTSTTTTTGSEPEPTTASPTTSTTSTSTTTTLTTTSTTSTGDTTGPGDGLVALHIDPPQLHVLVTSGWSFPAQFTVTGEDGDGMAIAVEAEWSLDDPALGTITRHGGSFQASNSAAGVATITASAADLQASVEVTIEIVDDHPVCPPRPPLVAGEPGPGAFVKIVAPEYEGTGVYHGLYLPPDWQPGRRYPMIVESPCNKYGDFTGKVDDATLGYNLAGCRHYVWLVLPYLENGANLDYGWGDVPATIAYWQTNLARTIETWGVDPGAVVVSGFSRGAIGASFVGLHDDAIADAWLGFFMHSHADVITNLTPDQGAGSATRMGRVGGRAALLSWGAAGDGGAANSLKGVELLTSFGHPPTTLAVPGVGHTDAWLQDDAASRQVAQQWLFSTVAARPGTHAIRGRVVDGDGHGVADAQIAAGAHVTRTDAHGYYALLGLVPGVREVACTHAVLTCSNSQMVDVTATDAQDVEFVASE